MSDTLTEDAPLVTTPGVKVAPMVKAFRLAENGTLSPFGWCIIACALLLISGGLRFWRDLQFRSVYQESANCPFPLSELPKVLGTWREIEGAEPQLDEETKKVAGATDSFIRVYTDSKSGETVSVLVLYGPADRVFGHTPVVCYPASGYQAVRSPTGGDSVTEGQLAVSDLAAPVRFSKAYYVKNVGGLSQYCEAFWTFRHNNQWLADAASRWKSFRYHPAMFKIQIHRPAVSISTEDGPSEVLAREIVREIERRVGAPGAAVADNSSPAPPTTK
jgi:Protein of unknown function (DUF3485)